MAKKRPAPPGVFRRTHAWVKGLETWKQSLLALVIIGGVLIGGGKTSWAWYNSFATKEWTIVTIAEKQAPLGQQIDQGRYESLQQYYRTNRQRINELKDKKSLTTLERETLDDYVRAQEKTLEKIRELEMKGYH